MVNWDGTCNGVDVFCDDCKPAAPNLCGFCHQAEVPKGTAYGTNLFCQPCEDYCEQESKVVYCSICDATGHGQPGHGPCPLEERGYWAGDN